MRVLQLIPSLALTHGGPSQAITMFEQACRLRNIAMDTATTDDDGPGKRITSRIHTDNDGTTRYYFKKNFDFYKVSFSFGVWLWRNIKYYDVIHIHALFSYTSTVAAIIARIKKVPYVIRPLGTLNHYGRQQRRPLLKSLSIRFIEGPALRHAAALHFTSLLEQQEAETLGIEMNSVVLPLAVNSIANTDVQVLAKKFPVLINTPYILFMSRLDPKKNIEALLQAFKLVRKTISTELACVVAGDGLDSYVLQLKKLATQEGIAEHVIWVGHLQAEEKNSALSGAELFVLASYSENFGIAAAEALSAGLPCVLSSGVALVAEAEHAGAAMVVSTESENIAAAIIKLLQNPALRKQMGANAKQFADQHYSIQVMGHGLQKLYDDIMKKAHHKASNE